MIYKKKLTFRCRRALAGMGLLEKTAVLSAKISPWITFLIVLPYFVPLSTLSSMQFHLVILFSILGIWSIRIRGDRSFFIRARLALGRLSTHSPRADWSIFNFEQIDFRRVELHAHKCTTRKQEF